MWMRSAAFCGRLRCHADWFDLAVLIAGAPGTSPVCLSDTIVAPFYGMCRPSFTRYAVCDVPRSWTGPPRLDAPGHGTQADRRMR